ncbi:hypothetical protein HHI36_002772 [Cryptolaemus montrouzieri]|uniref:Uncharacterized protein n=1 Tax=Cryptolaemus montrouzieri TaxID=559131 RepID=A0ABD2PBX7_9CUCU
MVQSSLRDVVEVSVEEDVASIRAVFVCVYRPTLRNKVSKMHQTLNVDTKQYDYNIRIFGDFNSDFLGEVVKTKFEELVSSYGLSRIHSSPSRKTTCSRTYIDNINLHDMGFEESTINLNEADHLAQVLYILTYPVLKKPL